MKQLSHPRVSLLVKEKTAGKREKIHATGEIQPFCVLEMNSGLSDNFSFIDNTNTGKSAEHSYQFLPNMDNKVDYSMTMNEQEIKKSSNPNSGRPKTRRDIKNVRSKQPACQRWSI